MSSVKKFFKYILWLIALYIFVSIASYGFILKAYKNVNEYEILSKTPKIEIIESKATYVNGYVLAKVSNNTGVEIDRTYVKIDLYGKRNIYLGTKYTEIKDFEKDETIEFKANYKFNGVESYKVSFVNSIANETIYNEKEELTNGLFELIGIAGLIMFLYYIF